MINGLYETHIFVEDLERSIEFYRDVMGLKQCRFSEERRIAFFWVGEDRQQMLGLWEKPKEQIDIRHFAFQCDPEWVVKESRKFLDDNNLTTFSFLGTGVEGPMVFPWMPAVATYFYDPDGHELEFIGLLDDQPQPEISGVVGYQEWLKMRD